MTKHKYSRNFSRGLALMNYILEDEGHSIREAAAEFKISRSTVEADLQYVAEEAFYSNRKDAKELQKKYIQMRRKLSVLSKKKQEIK